MKSNALFGRAARVLMVLVVVAMLFLFFSNDFGLVDIHKASIVVAVGVDVTDKGYEVTAQAAVPAPAQGAGKASYTQVTGSGATVADAVDDINAKTGFYPKLAFCNLLVLGESCAQRQLFVVLDYFYRNGYVPLTALVGMCRGSARELLGKKPADGGMSASAIQRAMSEELKYSANSSTVNLKLLAQDGGSKSASCYMPYIEFSDGASSSGGKEGNSGAGTGGKGGQEGEGGAAQFTCLKTAAFSNGAFAGLLNEEGAFALNLIRCGVRYAIVNTVYGGKNYTVGLKNTGGGARIGVKGGVPVLKLVFKASATLQDSESDPAAAGRADSHVVKDELVQSVTQTVKERMLVLEDFCRQKDCDLYGAARMLYEYEYGSYTALKGEVLPSLKVEYDIRIKSVG